MAGDRPRSVLREMSGLMRLAIHPYFFGAMLSTIFALSGIARAEDSKTQKYPDVVAVKVQAGRAGTFNFDVTISSPYDTPMRYADAFRVTSQNGAVFGERILVHDHAEEQPFTRDLYDVLIPHGVRKVIVQARDQKYGYGGKTVELTLPRR